MKILTFGIITEITGNKELNEEIPVASVGDLRIELLRRWPALKEMTFSIAVNHNIADDQTVVGSDSEVAILPPFSGG